MVDPADPPKRIQFNLAGVKHYQKLLKKLPAKTRAALLREPDNKYDPNAIAVYESGRHVGYIPRDEASWIVSVMDAGEWTYACSYMRVSWWDDGDIFTASLILERRRPGGDLIGSEHLPKSARSEPVPKGPSLVSKAVPHLIAFSAAAVTRLAAFSATAARGSWTAIKKIDQQLIRMCGDDVIMQYVARFVAVVIVLALIVVGLMWLF